MSELPDPKDRSQPWCEDIPAYLAHYKALSRRDDFPNGWHELVRAYSEAIPTLEALRLLATLSPLVELGAGAGYWARLLRDRGTEIVAYDPVAPESNDWTAKLHAWTEVRPGDAVTAITEHPDRVPFACWPPRPYGYMSDVLRTYCGTKIALITDGRFLGLEDHADPLYDVLESEWILDERVQLPHWPGRHDSLMTWRLKSTS